MFKRRSNHEGCLRLRADGRWELTYMVGFQPNGKRKYKSFYAETQAKVKMKAKEYWETNRDVLAVDKHRTFAAWSDIWFEGRKGSISPTTQESYQFTLRVLKNEFDHRRIADFKPYDIEIFLKKLQSEGYSYSYISKCRGMLFQIFAKAEANSLIRRNPVQFAEKMRRTEPVRRKECFSAEEVTTIMEQLSDDRIGWSIRLLLGTGMRTQELLALEPRHIEVDGSVIHIEQAVKIVKGKVVVGTPKSPDSYRDIPIPECIQACAIKLRNVDTKFIWELKVKDSPCNPSSFRTHFRKALEAIHGVRVLTPHSCRHTYVSQMQSLGVDMSTIQSLVGHSDISMTNHYLHVQPYILLDAAERFSKAFQPQ